MKRYKRPANSDTAMIVFLVILVVVTLVMITGHSVTSHTSVTAQPAVVMRVLDPTLEPYAVAWEQEIARRFPNAVAILVHGGDFVPGEWIVGTSLYGPQHVTKVKDVIDDVRRLYPDRTVVLLACNTGHLHLGIPGVYYAKSSVWCIPDRAVSPEVEENAGETLDGQQVTRWQADPDVVGNIFEFVED